MTRPSNDWIGKQIELTTDLTVGGESLQEGNIIEVLKSFLDEKGIGFIGENIAKLHSAASSVLTSQKADPPTQIVELADLEKAVKLFS